MPGEIKQERIYGNFKTPRGYARPREVKDRARDRRPGMSAAHLDCIRSLPCCACGALPRSDPHHLKSGTGERGMGLRSTDRFTVPLCRAHHEAVERIGSRNERRWFGGFGVDAPALADALWRASGNLDQMQKIVEAHRGN